MPTGELRARQAAILIPDNIAPYERGGGARTIPLVTKASGATSFINGMTIFSPNAAIPLHTHNCDESVVILEGQANAEIDGVFHMLGPGTTTFIPAGIPHRFLNASQTEDMKILWIYASVDATRTIVGTGNIRSIVEEHNAAARIG